MLTSPPGTEIPTAMDELTLLRQSQRHHHHHHHHIIRSLDSEIDLEIDADVDPDDPSFSSSVNPSHSEDDQKHLLLLSQIDSPDISGAGGGLHQPKRKKKVVKKWRDEWTDTYKWAYVDINEGSTRIFCSVCREYGRKHRRNPYGNEGSRNMQMSALEEHNNSLLHKEALRLQMASKDKTMPPAVQRPVYVALMSKTAGSIVESVVRRDPHEAEYIQSVQEVVHSLEPVLMKNTQYIHILERLLEAERVFVFRVPWADDRGETHVSRGFRVQFSQALGPCRGSLRFHPSMNLSIAKFLALEQTLKNALSQYKLGGAAGGSDFDPKGKSENEIMRFCQSFMDELYRYLGSDKDLPAEDIGVGPREMGYLFGQYKRLAGHYQGSFTGPKIFWSGSTLRTDATAFGLVHFAHSILSEMHKDIKGIRCVVSGAGKIAIHVIEKLFVWGAIPLTISDSKGYLVDEDGFVQEKITLLRDIKIQQRSLRDYIKSYPQAKYYEDGKPWNTPCDIAFPCASQNEIDQSEAIALVNAGCRLLIEGSNMPCTPQAIDVLRKAKVLVVPAKASGAGGVAIGELELNHECNLMQWSVGEFEAKLQDTLKDTHGRVLKAANDYGFLRESPEAMVHGANICAFLNLAQAMIEQGVV